jgi:hypothetical protein
MDISKFFKALFENKTEYFTEKTPDVCVGCLYSVPYDCDKCIDPYEVGDSCPEYEFEGL